MATPWTPSYAEYMASLKVANPSKPCVCETIHQPNTFQDASFMTEQKRRAAQGAVYGNTVAGLGKSTTSDAAVKPAELRAQYTVGHAARKLVQ